MTYAIRTLQARCAALGFWPGPIDGRMGPRTRESEAAARESQRAKGLPFIHSSGLTRIHWHWTAGWNKANSTDKKAYHTLFEGDGFILRMWPYEVVLAHTANANTGAIALSLCGMHDAVERPWRPGTAPITPAQVGALARESAALCREYDIPVSPWSTLSHAEIQPTLGIAQRLKWDITWLPGMSGPGDPIGTGDRLRELVRRELSR